MPATDTREAWRLFAAHYHPFRGTPSRLWLDHVFAKVFGLDVALEGVNPKTSPIYDPTLPIGIGDGLQIGRQRAASHSRNMLTFGFSTLIDLLSWVAALAIGLKIAATLFVLIVNKDMRDQPGWGSALWWVTMITPIVVVSCLI